MTDFPAPVSTHLRTITLFPPERPLLLECGATLTDVQVAYETWGPPDGPAVFVCHALTGDSHVTAHDPADRPGWWESMVGPGRPVDTDAYHVVCANVLGGCAGTTGPWSRTAGGQRRGAGFPPVAIVDMVAVHRELMAALGIRRLHAVIGGSLGGMQVLEWLLRRPDDASVFLPIATSGRLSTDNLAFNAVARAAIRSDPDFADGHYPDDAPPERGLGLARMIGHLTYLSPQSLQHKAGRDVQPGPEIGNPAIRGPFTVERYLEHQARKLVRRFDANTYLYLTAAMDAFDAFTAPVAVPAEHPPRVHLVSFAADRLFGIEHTQAIQAELSGCGITASHYHDEFSVVGHDAFLLENPGYQGEVRRCLDSRTAAASPRRDE
jgi:homoserine O-acetyltransferase/O-succinyltransferase